MSSNLIILITASYLYVLAIAACIILYIEDLPEPYDKERRIERARGILLIPFICWFFPPIFFTTASIRLFKDALRKK